MIMTKQKLLLVATFVLTLKIAKTDNEQFEPKPEYYHHSDLELLFKQLERIHNNYVKLHSIGYSVNGKQLLVLQISNNVKERVLLKPMFKYVGNMHGDESVGRQLIIYLAEYLLLNYGIDPRVTKLLNTTDIYLMPSMNPDGFEKSMEGRCKSLNNFVGRNNANGQDLNRDFPDQFYDKQNFGFEKRQTETVNMMKWILSNPFVLSANLHGGAVVGSYPYDDSDSGRDCCQDSISPDHELVKHLASVYAQRNPMMKNGDACLPEKFNGGITNGANWYELKGGMQDFNYVYSNCVEITFELSCCKYPSATTLPSYWNQNKESLLKFIEQVHNGVKGIVQDENNNSIAGASVKIYGKIVTTNKRGEFWKLLLPGNYSIQVSASGFVPSKEHLITVIEGVPKIFNITLTEQRKLKLKPTIINQASEYQDGFLLHNEYRHHSNRDLEALLRDLFENYPAITQMKSIGKSVNGQNLWVFEISENPGRRISGKPAVKLVANMHGNEVVGREILLLLAKYLCENYLTDKQVTKITNSTRVLLLPTMNPDGYDMAKLGDVSSSVGRNNANNIDLNRNFPDQYATTSPNIKIEPETRAVMEWTLSEQFILSANLHGGALVANYPFDNNPPNFESHKAANLSPDDDVFIKLARTYSMAHRKMHLGKPCQEHPNETFVDGITNGAAWYPIPGSMQDWNYIYASCFELTLELGCFKYPPAKLLPELWMDNKWALLAYVEQAHLGLHGHVRSSISNPITSAEIIVQGRKHITKVNSEGEYYRLLLPGRYNITASADGYESQTVLISIPNDDTPSLSVNFTLMRNDPQHWSSAYDFRLIQHVINTRYRYTHQIVDLMAELEKKHPDTIEFQNGYEDAFKIIPRIKMTKQIGSSEETKFHFLILGGLFGSEAVGHEMVLNLAEHLITAFKIGEPKHTKILENVVFHMIPVLDENFDQTLRNYRMNEDICDPESDQQEFGDRVIISNSDRFVNAFKQILNATRFDIILNFASGGFGLSFPKMNFLYDGILTNIHNKIMSSSQKCNFSQGNQNYGEITERLTNLVYREFNAPIISIRASCCRMPRENQLTDVWQRSLSSLMEILELAETGIEGKIYDNAKNNLRNAVVTITRFQMSFNASKNLAYYKIILPEGRHKIIFSAKGFKNKTLILDVRRGELLYNTVTLINMNEAKYFSENTTVQEAISLNGYVLDIQGHPLSNALVMIENPVKNTTTNKYGSYFLSCTNCYQEVTVIASARSYINSKKIINSSILRSKNFKLIFNLEKDQTILGLSQLAFIIITVCTCMMLIALVFCCYTCVKQRMVKGQSYESLHGNIQTNHRFKNILLDDDQNDELFKLPEGTKIFEPYFDDDNIEYSDSSEEEISYISQDGNGHTLKLLI